MRETDRFIGRILTAAKWQTPYKLHQPIETRSLSSTYIAYRIDQHGKTTPPPYFVKVLPAYAPAQAQMELDIHRAVSQHPDITTVHNWGITAEGNWFLVSEFLAGGTLRRALSNHAWLQTDCLHAFRTLCRTVAFLHASGYGHHDIKLSNILLRDERDIRRVVLTDFSLATDGTLKSDTVLGQGTRLERSPEQIIAGWPVGRAADIFQLGLVLLALLYGIPTATQHAQKVEHAPRRHHPLPRQNHPLSPLLHAMLTPYPPARPTAQQLLNISLPH